MRKAAREVRNHEFPPRVKFFPRLSQGGIDSVYYFASGERPTYASCPSCIHPTFLVPMLLLKYLKKGEELKGNLFLYV